MNYYFTYDDGKVSGFIETESYYPPPRFVPVTKEQVLEEFPGYIFKPDPIREPPSFEEPPVEQNSQEVSELKAQVESLQQTINALLEGLT